MKLYGNLPVDLGFVGEDIDCDEMMYYLYLPIKTPGTRYVSLEERLDKFLPLVSLVAIDNDDTTEDWWDKYVYLTVKTMYVSPGCMGQRPGWHSDGFMTDDINYIWYTDVPTVFWKQETLSTLPQDHEESLGMLQICEDFPKQWVTFPNRHLLRLDESVIHKSDTNSSFVGVRTFVKISVSDHVYALKGNSINPHVPLNVEYKNREEHRNCPASHRM